MISASRPLRPMFVSSVDDADEENYDLYNNNNN